MFLSTTQLVVEYQGKSYSGIFSDSGSNMIGRIPGVGSREKAVDPNGSMEQYRSEAKALFSEMLSAVEDERPPMDA